MTRNQVIEAGARDSSSVQHTDALAVSHSDELTISLGDSEATGDFFDEDAGGVIGAKEYSTTPTTHCTVAQDVRWYTFITRNASYGSLQSCSRHPIPGTKRADPESTV